MSTINLAEVVDLGACQAKVNNVDVGHFDENGLKGMVKSTIVVTKAALYGSTPGRHFLNGQEIEFEGELIQTAGFDNLGVALPGATVVTDTSGHKKITFGKIAGSEIPAVDLELTPYLSGNDPAYKLVCKVAPVGDFELLYAGKQEQRWKVKWAGVINEAAGSDGNFLFSFGDPSINPDTTPPTVSAVAPTNNQTLAAPASIVWTLSEALNPDTVNTQTVQVVDDATSPSQKVGTVVLVNNGASTTITFTPTTPFASATKYLATLNGVKDKAGNPLAFFASQFTTT